jgi:hypothetical protein
MLEFIGLLLIDQKLVDAPTAAEPCPACDASVFARKNGSPALS